MVMVGQLLAHGHDLDHLVRTYSRRRLLLQSEAITAYVGALAGADGGSEVSNHPDRKVVTHPAAKVKVPVATTDEERYALFTSGLARLQNASRDVARFADRAGGLESAVRAQDGLRGKGRKASNRPDGEAEMRAKLDELEKRRKKRED